MTGAPGGTVVIEHTVRIAATPSTVWTFWTDPARVAQWWGVAAEVVPEPGGRFRVEIGDGPAMRGEFVELDPPHRLVFTFGWEHRAPGEPLAPGSTRVEVRMEPDPDGTLLVLRHAELPEADAAEHGKGWAYYLGELLPAAVVR